MWPDFNFRQFPLSSDARSQLDGVYSSVVRKGEVPCSKGRLHEALLSRAYLPVAGTYMCLSSDVELLRKLPTYSKVAEITRRAFPTCFFSNALVIPPGYGDLSFDPTSASKPSKRATNNGVMVLTHEFDCATTDELEENLDWMRKGRKAQAPIVRLLTDLRRYKDFMGVTAVFSGSRSVHLHLTFSTGHLVNAPVHANAAARSIAEQEADSALLHNVHDTLWDRVGELLLAALKPSMDFDHQMRSLTKYRRAPFGIRVLDKPSDILGLPAGAVVPQLVLFENLRLERASKGSDEYIIPPDFSITRRRTLGVTRQKHQSGVSVGEDVLDVIREVCAAGLGVFPRPTSVSHTDEGWLIRFQNHTEDRTPSTIVLGDHQQLKLGGRHPFGSRAVFLPDDFTANELVDHARIRCGWPDEEGDDGRETCERARPRRPRHLWIEELERRAARRRCEEPETARSWLQSNVGKVRDWTRGFWMTEGGKTWYSPPSHTLLKSVEGIGKTATVQDILQREILDDYWYGEATSDQFGAFAFRSDKQVQDKAAEYRARDGHAVVVKSFSSMYKEACDAVDEEPLIEGVLRSSREGVLAAISANQPAVFDELKSRRAHLWSDARFGRFSPTWTMLFMNHALAMRWHHSVMTRLWYHPDFDPDLPMEEQLELRMRIQLSKVAFDEPSVDEVLWRIPDERYCLVASAQERFSGWRNRPTHERYELLRSLGPAVRTIGFDTFDELMRIQLESLTPVDVDFDVIPFGFDNRQDGIYRRQHGTRFYIGPQRWMIDSGAEWIYLTTECLVTDAVTVAYDKLGHLSLLARCDFDEIPGMFPVKVPVVIDRRANAQGLPGLVREITGAKPKALIIADRVKDEKVINFHGMKGSNAFKDADVFIVLTALNPNAYALLAATGIFLGTPDVIATHYSDELAQAVGRNRGFRASKEETITAVVTTNRLWKSVIRDVGRRSRVRLFQTGQLWSAGDQ